MKRVPYDRDYDLLVPDHLEDIKNPKKYIILNCPELLDEYLSPRRAKKAFSDKSGPKGSRKGY